MSVLGGQGLARVVEKLCWGGLWGTKVLLGALPKLSQAGGRQAHGYWEGVEGPHPDQQRMPQSLLGKTAALRVGTRGPPLCPRHQRAHLPAFFTKPRSASSTSHSSQRKQPGCQLAFMALITRPMTNSPGRGETSAVTALSPPFSTFHVLCTQCSSLFSLVQPCPSTPRLGA